MSWKKNIFAHFERVTISFLDHIRIQSVDGKPKSPGQPVGAGGCESHPLPLVGEWKIIPHDSLSSKTCILLGVYTDGWFIPLLVCFWAWWPTRRTCPLPWSPVSFHWLATGFLAGLETLWMCSGTLSASSMWPTNFLFSVFATMLGISITLGLGTVQINQGLHLLFSSVPVTSSSQMAIIWLVTAIATVSVITGRSRICLCRWLWHSISCAKV